MARGAAMGRSATVARRRARGGETRARGRGGRCARGRASVVDTWNDGDAAATETETETETETREGRGERRVAVRVNDFEARADSAPKVVVFSGGTAMNVIAVELSELTQKVTHVIPVSDNGGSTSEIVRVLGGPAVGDLRSRCLRVTDESTPEAVAVKALLGTVCIRRIARSLETSGTRFKRAITSCGKASDRTTRTSFAGSWCTFIKK